jgi:hypothetical protein
MLRCAQAQARTVRKLERHQQWLQRNIPSKSLHRECQRQLLLLRTDLCLRLSCAGSEVVRVLEQQ